MNGTADKVIEITRSRYDALIRKEVILETILRAIATEESYDIKDTVKLIVGNLYPEMPKKEDMQ